MPRGRRNSGKSVEKIPDSFDPCGEDVQNLLRDLIRECHTDLVNAKIALLYKNKEIKKKGDRVVFAKVSKAGPILKALTDYDYVIVIPYPTWKDLAELEKKMVLDHELCHCLVDEDEKTGDTKYMLIDHDFNEFGVIIRRYGFTGHLERLGLVVKEVE